MRWSRLLLFLFLTGAGAARAEEKVGHPAPDVYFFYELDISRDTVRILHETRWTDLVALRLRERIEGRSPSFEEGVLAFAREWARRVQRRFEVYVDEERVPLPPPEVNYDIYVPTPDDLARRTRLDQADAGEVDVRLYRGTSWELVIWLDFEVPLPAADVVRLELREHTYDEGDPEFGVPWVTNAVSAHGAEGLTFLSYTTPENPLYLTPVIRLEFDWSGTGPAEVDWEEYEDPNRQIRDRLSQIIASRDPLLSLTFIVGLILAFLYGMGHALAPGHGKAMVAAYLIGTRGRKRDAVLLGLIVTLAHTGSVILLALSMLLFLEVTQAKHVQQWLAVASGIGIIGIGLWLFRRNLRAYRRGEIPGQAHHHDHGHSHGHGHHHHHHGPPKGGGVGFRQLLALGLTGGIVPCPGALFAFFLSLQAGLHFRGLLVVLSFSVGLALVLVTIGLLMVTSSRILERVAQGQARLQGALQALPVVSATIVTLVGVVATYRAFATGPGL